MAGPHRRIRTLGSWRRPVIPGARSAPCQKGLAGLIKRDHRWRGLPGLVQWALPGTATVAGAAGLTIRGQVCRFHLRILQRAGALDDPDVVPGVDMDADDLTEPPLGRQRLLRPRLVILKLGNRMRPCDLSGRADPDATPLLAATQSAATMTLVEFMIAASTL